MITTADQMNHKFKNPSFSGVGTSAHYLTIENQEKTRKDAIISKRVSDEEKRQCMGRHYNLFAEMFCLSTGNLCREVCCLCWKQ